jgi:hypothetical protein
VDSATYVQNLPNSLAAVFVLDNVAHSAGDGAQALHNARRVHESFLAHYPWLTAADVPLLGLSLHNGDAPFRVISG